LGAFALVAAMKILKVFSNACRSSLGHCKPEKFMSRVRASQICVSKSVQFFSRQRWQRRHHSALGLKLGWNSGPSNKKDHLSMCVESSILVSVMSHLPRYLLCGSPWQHFFTRRLMQLSFSKSAPSRRALRPHTPHTKQTLFPCCVSI
jgi:hypothetical protein